jgi:ATP phosphoribosyltransferase
MPAPPDLPTLPPADAGGLSFPPADTAGAAPITLALSKGRIFSDTLPLLARAGITVPEDPETSRKLILATSRSDLRVVLVRASDVPTYVEHGGADLGVAGLDTLLEHDGGLYRPLDLGIARCRMSVAVREDFDYVRAVRQGSRLRVATKYVQTARRHFAAKGVHVDLIKLYGSMELAPLTGLADAIVDLVSTGSTLRANRLVEVERILDVSARLVVNPAALKLRREPLRALIDALAAAVAAAGAASGASDADAVPASPAAPARVAA